MGRAKRGPRAQDDMLSLIADGESRIWLLRMGTCGGQETPATAGQEAGATFGALRTCGGQETPATAGQEAGATSGQLGGQNSGLFPSRDARHVVLQVVDSKEKRHHSAETELDRLNRVVVGEHRPPNAEHAGPIANRRGS